MGFGHCLPCGWLCTKGIRLTFIITDQVALYIYCVDSIRYRGRPADHTLHGKCEMDTVDVNPVNGNAYCPQRFISSRVPVSG